MKGIFVMKRIIQWSVLSLSIVSIFGCSNIRNNILVPSQLPKEDKIAEDLEKKYLSCDGYESKIYNKEKKEFEPKWEDSEIKKYTDKFEEFQADGLDEKEKEALKVRRNAIIGNLIILLNIRYSQYERAFYNIDASLGSAFDITTLAVTATGAVAGGAATKSILSAIAAGLTGSRLALEKNFLYEQTSPVLMAKMRSLREEKLRIIDERMNKSIQEYPLERGLIDVQDFFYCGTISGALQSISADIGKQPTYNEIIKSFKDMRAKVNNVFEDSANADTNGSATTAVR